MNSNWRLLAIIIMSLRDFTQIPKICFPHCSRPYPELTAIPRSKRGSTGLRQLELKKLEIGSALAPCAELECDRDSCPSHRLTVLCAVAVLVITIR